MFTSRNDTEKSKRRQIPTKDFRLTKRRLRVSTIDWRSKWRRIWKATWRRSRNWATKCSTPIPPSSTARTNPPPRPSAGWSPIWTSRSRRGPNIREEEPITTTTTSTISTREMPNSTRNWAGTCDSWIWNNLKTVTKDMTQNRRPFMSNWIERHQL